MGFSPTKMVISTFGNYVNVAMENDDYNGPFRSMTYLLYNLLKHDDFP
jgi:hypothetical protein